MTARPNAAQGLSPDALDGLPVLISHIGGDLTYRFMNRAYEHWFGHSRETMLGRTMVEVLGETAWERLEPYVRRALSGETVRFEGTAPYRDGGTRQIVAHYSPAEDGFYAIVEDVSAVQRAEQKAEAILHALPDPFIAVDARLVLTFANAAALTFLPEGARLTGQSLAGRLPPDREALLHQVLTRQEPLEIEMASAVQPDRLLHMRIFPLNGGLGVHARDVTDRRRAEKALADSERRLAAAADAVLGIAYDWDLATDTVVRSAGLERLVGVRLDQASPTAEWWRERVHPDDLSRIEAGAASRKESQWVEQEYRVRHEDGRWIDVLDRAQVLFDDEGQAVRVVGTTIDITDLKQGEARLRILVDEVNHRVKNTLAVVQSIAALSSRSAPDIQTFVAGFRQRLASMARAHDLLTRRHWTDATLREVVDSALDGYGEPPRLKAQGPAVLLTPKAAVALSLALHELAVNAVKYGALGEATGRVDLTWARDADQVVLVWRESDGPPVVPPDRAGFGTRLMDSVARDLGGQISSRYAPTGLVCEIRFAPEAA